MESPLNHNAQARSAQHPLMILAAIAVVLFCAVGIAAIMGWIPTSVGAGSAQASAAPRGDLSEADRAVLTAKMGSANLASQPAPAMLAANLSPAPAPSNYIEPERQQAAPVREAAYRPEQVAAAAPAKNWCNHCGNVESVREITTRAQGSGVGAAGGAILGGLLGNQVGGGTGRQLATVAGAVGGAVVGNQVEGNMKANHSYEIRVRMDDGGTRTFHQQNAPGWREGNRVKVVNGSLRSVR
ncbi:glycine zipper 2TM domain-containing protein [Massilia sp. DWR3-1-1]|uniref:glycine zipper 2TM domain-containing protein n=1 Tax=Massilia sp. DWR3-1-1 TaxID=2804559 RepID=UPI003CFA2256